MGLIIAGMLMNLTIFSRFRICLVFGCVIYSSLAFAEWRSTSFNAMGTRFELELWSPSQALSEALYKDIEQEITRLERLWSPYIQTSEISQINAQAGIGAVQVSKETFAIIQHSIKYSQLSAGAFDISFATLGRHYNYRDSKKPEDSKRKELQQLIDYKSIKVQKRVEQGVAAYAVELPSKHMAIDLGGIAKGYAIDSVADLLLAKGVQSAAISLGGDSRFIGDRGPSKKSDQRLPWVVAIKHPRKSTQERPHALRMPLSNSAFSTSGDYERYFIDEAGERVHHIIDTKNGRSASEVVSVSIIGGKSLDCDVLSTTIFVLGVKEGLALIEKNQGFDAIIIDRKGKVHYSSGLVE